MTNILTDAFFFHSFYSKHFQWASSEAQARLTLQAEGKLDKPVFGVHYDTPENKFDFESVNPDNPFNEEDDDDDDDDDIAFESVCCNIPIMI